MKLGGEELRLKRGVGRGVCRRKGMNFAPHHFATTMATTETWYGLMARGAR